MAQANMEIENIQQDKMQQDNMKAKPMDQENSEQEKDPTLKFIEAVKEHKCIWDMQSEEYYNRRIYRAAWRALLPPSDVPPPRQPLNSAQKADIKKKVAELQKVWVELRDSYYKNEDPGRKYKDSLRFLHSVYQSREMEAVLEFDEPSWDLMDLRTWTVKKSHIPKKERITDPAPEYELKRVRKRKIVNNILLNAKKGKATDKNRTTDKENATDHKKATGEENASKMEISTDKLTDKENATDKRFVTDGKNVTDMENSTNKQNRTNKKKTTDKENMTDKENPPNEEIAPDEANALNEVNAPDEVKAPDEVNSYNNKNLTGLYSYKVPGKENAPDEVNNKNKSDKGTMAVKVNAPDEVNNKNKSDKGTMAIKVNAPDEVNALSDKNVASKESVADKGNTSYKDNASTSKEKEAEKEKNTVKKNKPNENQLSILEKAMRLYELENPGIWSSDEEDPDKASRVYVDNTSQTNETVEFPNMPINMEWWLDRN
ncbi:hypothetical protein PYW08_000189 [Mythimna loreyi]|uniref:Uncharacterized protein n=1 Tax=Mythimna loreyi TaxID=667449 RepID=A0ACC2RAL5_9NEOP|nr:hypothetical protein PYW08_000189 [Mythimna loreyi]